MDEISKLNVTDLGCLHSRCPSQPPALLCPAGREAGEDEKTEISSEIGGNFSAQESGCVTKL